MNKEKVTHGAWLKSNTTIDSYFEVSPKEITRTHKKVLQTKARVEQTQSYEAAIKKKS